MAEKNVADGDSGKSKSEKIPLTVEPVKKMRVVHSVSVAAKPGVKINRSFRAIMESTRSLWHQHPLRQLIMSIKVIVSFILDTVKFTLNQRILSREIFKIRHSDLIVLRVIFGLLSQSDWSGITLLNRKIQLHFKLAPNR